MSELQRDMRSMMLLAAALGISVETAPRESFPPLPDEMEVYGTKISRGSRGNKYTPHQGAKERARRLKQP